MGGGGGVLLSALGTIRKAEGGGGGSLAEEGEVPCIIDILISMDLLNSARFTIHGC